MKTIFALFAFACVACCDSSNADANPEQTKMDFSELGHGIKESKSGGWSGNADLVTGNAAKVGTFQANFPVAGMYTLQFNVSPGPSTAANQNNPIRAEALISWSVEGNTVTRRVSIVNGTSVSGPGQAVKVQFFDVTDTSGGAATLGRAYNVTVQVTPGTRPSINEPPTLVQQSFPLTVLAGGSQDIPIPADAGAISAYVTVGYAAAGPYVDGDLEVQQIVGPGAGTLAKAYDPIRFANWVPLVPGCSKITVHNNSARNYQIGVAVGIDG